MKRITTFLIVLMCCSLFFAEDYEPQRIPASIDEDVLFYIADMNVGFTSVTMNKLPTSKKEDLTIRAKNGDSFKIVNFTSTTLNEALDANEKVLAYLVTNMKIKEEKIEELNRSIKNKQVTFMELINQLGDNDFNKTISGSQNPPDKDSFESLRHVFAYNIYVESSNKNIIQLQVVVEAVNKASEL